MASGLDAESTGPDWYQAPPDSGQTIDARKALFNMISQTNGLADPRDIVDGPRSTIPPNRDALLVLLPLLIVLSSLLFLLLLFLVCILLLRRRRGIALRDTDGPIDMSREELIDGEGGFEVIEERWLESVDEESQRQYRRAKEFQSQYPPNSLPTDITLSQFLSIQEKGVSAWSFEPDYESNASLLVHARTELTFLPDPSSSSSVQSNLPLPKLNEVYYWEVKLFDYPEGTNIAIGLSTKPYPAFRLPGQCRFSVAYHSNGDKSHNYPFTAHSYGQPLKEGDVLGIGYRPRSGTVFFTRNGRKMDDAYVGLTRWNLFPTVGADGPCSLHVNFGQSGFVFIEANVKKWGLAPSVGTLAPPPPYGNERGSILLEAGGGVRHIQNDANSLQLSAAPLSSSRRRYRSRRSRDAAADVAQSSPLRNEPTTPLSPPPPITPIEEEPNAGPSSHRYISPTDSPFHTSIAPNLPSTPPGEEVGSGESSRTITPPSHSRSTSPVARLPRTAGGHSRHNSAAEMVLRLQPPPESPLNPPEPPTPGATSDIHLRALTSTASQTGVASSNNASDPAGRPPPAYSPLDAYRYADGVQVDLPAEVIAAALEGGTIPASAIGAGQNDRNRSRRDRRR